MPPTGRAGQKIYRALGGRSIVEGPAPLHATSPGSSETQEAEVELAIGADELPSR